MSIRMSDMSVVHDGVGGAYTVVFEGLKHLGPGDAALTREIAMRLRPKLPPRPRVADLGCGVGASAMVLAQSLPGASVLAVDFHAPFIQRLEHAVSAAGLGDRVRPVVGDMAEPPALDGVVGDFSLIWSESAIYSIGRGDAFSRWRPLLSPDGWLVFSDIVWARDPSRRAQEASAFWEKEYPDIATARAVMEELMNAGFEPLDPLLAGHEAWANYYEPLRGRLDALAQRTSLSPGQTGLLGELRKEIEVYDRYGDEVELCFFLAKATKGQQTGGST